jgi:hypothetical protein
MEETVPIGVRNLREQGTIGRDLFEQVSGCLESLAE